MFPNNDPFALTLPKIRAKKLYKETNKNQLSLCEVHL